MRLLLIILFLFTIDIYFYLGTVSITKGLTYNGLIYKVLYWIFSILVYLGIIYIVLTYDTHTYSVRSSNNIIYTSLFFILFASKLIGSIPLLIDDLLRLMKLVSSFLPSSKQSPDLSRLDFLKKSALIFSGTLFSTLLLGMTWGRYNFKKNYQNIYINNWPSSLNNYKIIHISDLHLGTFNIEKLNEVVEMINIENSPVNKELDSLYD